MRHRTINYALLVIIVAWSFLAIYTFDFYPNLPYDKSMDRFRILGPGVLFSFFIVFIQRSNFTTLRLVLFFFALQILYCASFLAGFSSWGLGVPLAGGIGALLIRKLFYQKAEWFDPIGKRFLLLGFIAGLVGFVLYALSHDVWTQGTRFGFILVVWQLVFGFLWIRQTQEDSIIRRV